MIEGCHEAIVTPEEWAQVQEVIDRRPTIMQGNACPFYNISHGIIYCATCGKSMQVRYEKIGRTGKNRFTRKEREPIDKAYYICQTYNRLGKDACTSHKVEARDLYNLVLKDIQNLAGMALKDADAFYNRLSSRMESRYMTDASGMQKECVLICTLFAPSCRKLGYPDFPWGSSSPTPLESLPLRQSKR